MFTRISYMVWLSFCMACTVPLCAQPSTQPVPDGHLGSRNPRVIAVRSELEYALKKHDEEMAKALGITEAIRKATGRIEVSAELLHQAAGKLDDQLMDLELEEAGGQARMDAVDMEMHNLSQRTQAVTDQDAAATELEKVVASRQKEYDRMVKLQAAATVTQEMVEDAAAQLAEAKARVAVRREQAVAAAGGDMLTALRKQLTDLNIAEADRNARLKYLTQQREKLEKGLLYVDELQHTKAEADSLEQRIDELELQLRSIAN